MLLPRGELMAFSHIFISKSTFFFFQFIDKKTEELAFLEDEYQRALADIGLGKVQ